MKPRKGKKKINKRGCDRPSIGSSPIRTYVQKAVLTRYLARHAPDLEALITYLLIFDLEDLTRQHCSEQWQAGWPRTLDSFSTVGLITCGGCLGLKEGSIADRVL